VGADCRSPESGQSAPPADRPTEPCVIRDLRALPRGLRRPSVAPGSRWRLDDGRGHAPALAGPHRIVFCCAKCAEHEFAGDW